jgi:hypothetical protein
MRRRNKYQVTTMTVTTIGAVQATKIPWLNEMRMHAGSNASLANEYAMFSMATHREALRPIMTESCNAKIVQRTTEATKRALQPSDDGKKL